MRTHQHVLCFLFLTMILTSHHACSFGPHAASRRQLVLSHSKQVTFEQDTQDTFLDFKPKRGCWVRFQSLLSNSVLILKPAARISNILVESLNCLWCVCRHNIVRLKLPTICWCGLSIGEFDSQRASIKSFLFSKMFAGGRNSLRVQAGHELSVGWNWKQSPLSKVEASTKANTHQKTTQRHTFWWEHKTSVTASYI